MSTVHFTSHTITRANFSCVWLKLTLQCSLCALSPKLSSSRAHVMFRTLLDRPLTSLKLDSCLAALPNRLKWVVQKQRQHFYCQGCIGLTFNSSDDIAITPAVSEVGERSDLGMLASPLLSTSAKPFEIYHSNGESSEKSFSHYRSGTERPIGERSKQKKIKSRLECFGRASFREKSPQWAWRDASWSRRRSCSITKGVCLKRTPLLCGSFGD